MKTVAIIGACGQLGTDLVKTFQKKKWQVISLDLPRFDVTQSSMVKRTFSTYSPQIIVNTAAYHFLPDCEAHPDVAFAVNALGVKFLSLWAATHNAVMAHISTDYVFGGDLARRRPYSETDQVAPQSMYAISKAAGEFVLKQTCPRSFLIRTSGLFGAAGSAGKGGNFVDKRVEQARRGEVIRMVDDQVLSPTYTLNLAENIALLVTTRKYGTYHMASHGYCSWYNFTKEILRLIKIKTRLVAVKTDDRIAGVIRPRFSALSTKKLHLARLDHLNHWRINLRLYLHEKGFIHE